jgi:hypothetical protein
MLNAQRYSTFSPAHDSVASSQPPCTDHKAYFPVEACNSPNACSRDPALRPALRKSQSLAPLLDRRIVSKPQCQHGQVFRVYFQYGTWQLCNLYRRRSRGTSWLGWEIARCCGVCGKESTRMMRTLFIKEFWRLQKWLLHIVTIFILINRQSRMN